MYDTVGATLWRSLDASQIRFLHALRICSWRPHRRVFVADRREFSVAANVIENRPERVGLSHRALGVSDRTVSLSDLAIGVSHLDFGVSDRHLGAVDFSSGYRFVSSNANGTHGTLPRPVSQRHHGDPQFASAGVARAGLSPRYAAGSVRRDARGADQRLGTNRGDRRRLSRAETRV